MKVFTLAIPNLVNRYLHPFIFKRSMDFIENLPGLCGFFDDNPHGCILAFATVTHAEKARKKIIDSGNLAGLYIMNAELDDEKSSLRIIDPVDGWPEGFSPEEYKKEDNQMVDAEKVLNGLKWLTDEGEPEDNPYYVDGTFQAGQLAHDAKSLIIALLGSETDDRK